MGVVASVGLAVLFSPDCSRTEAGAQVQLVDKGRFQKCQCFAEDDKTSLLWDVEMLVIRDLRRSLVQPLFGTGPYPALGQVSYGFIKVSLENLKEHPPPLWISFPVLNHLPGRVFILISSLNLLSCNSWLFLLLHHPLL